MNIDTSEISELIQGERSAVETYKQVFDKYGEKVILDDLRTLSADHKEAVRDLGDMAKAANVKVPDSSGVWGVWAQAITGTAKAFDKKAALQALKEGEEHGLKQYESALGKDIPASMRSKINTSLIPNQKRHIAEIDRLMTRV